MNYSIELKFSKSDLWTKNKLLFYLKIKKCYYETIIETDEYFTVTIEEMHCEEMIKILLSN